MAGLFNPSEPKDDGKISLPSVTSGMNRRGPGPTVGKSPDDDKFKWLGREKKEESDEKILQRARSRMKRCIESEAENRKKALEALKFKAGDQWPADIAAQRNMDKRPCITVNKIPTFIHQVTNDQRQNRPAINISPVGDKADVQAAKMYRGIIRAIERNCRADIAYDTAFESAVSAGWGYWRIVLEWESPDSFKQVPVIKRVRNPFSIYLDCDCQEPDGSDATYGFASEFVTKEEFQDTWPNANLMSYDQGGIGDRFKEWVGKDGIRIAEYYEIVWDKRTLLHLENGFVGFADEMWAETQDQIKSGKLMVRRKREVQHPRVMRYKLTAVDILEREEWLGEYIPIIRVVGNEHDIEGKLKLTGLVHDSIGPQQMYNYWRTMETELVALAPKAPYIIEEGQVEGYERQWKNAHTRSYPYLPYRGVNIAGKQAPPPQRAQPVQIPEGVVNAAQAASMDMQATTGIRFDASMQERMNDESGRAIRELRRSGDLGSFHFVDNLMLGLHYTALQLLDLIPKLFDERDVYTIIREDDKEEQIFIDPDAAKSFDERQTSEGMMKVFNPQIAKYGVRVTMGPSYATKRIEAAESMISFAKAVPQTANLIADLIAKNMDWPGAEEIANRLAKAVPPALMQPEPKDMTPQIAAVIKNLETQVQQSHQQLQQAMAALNDKEKDRDIAREKVMADFEAKVLAIMQKADAETVKAQQAKVEHLAETVLKLTELMKPAEPTPKPQQKDSSDA